MKKQKARPTDETHAGEGGRAFEGDARSVSDGKKRGHDMLNTDYNDTNSIVNSPAEARQMDDRLADQPERVPYSRDERRHGDMEKRDTWEEMNHDLSEDRGRGKSPLKDDHR